jgi:hypothetical protein
VSNFVTFPDAQLWAADVLNAALAAGVYSSLPNAPTFPMVVVQRIGGVPTERHALDRARLQVSVWGRNLTEAQSLAQQARQALHAAEGNRTGFAFVTAVEDDLGLAFLRDPETGRDRYIFGVVVTLTAAA